MDQAVRAAHLDDRVVLPLRHKCTAYRGVNVIAFWRR
jgi:antirestriction protein ArdC